MAPGAGGAGARRRGRRGRAARPGAAGAAGWPSCQVGQVELKALKTLPPKPYTQGELVKTMKGVAKTRDRPAPEAEAQGHHGHRHRGHARQHHQRAAGRGYLVKKGPRHPRVGCGLHVDRRGAGGHRRSGHDGGVGQALDMIEAGQMTLDTFIAKQSELGRPARAAVPRRHARLKACRPRRTARSAAPDAPAHRQERRVLVLQPLPGLQGARSRSKTATGKRGASAHIPTHASAQGETDARFPLPRRPLADGGQTSCTRGTPQRAFPSATVCASC